YIEKFHLSKPNVIKGCEKCGAAPNINEHASSWLPQAFIIPISLSLISASNSAFISSITPSSEVIVG
ncbi:MAG: hypothetical protein RIQ94_2802, partial [Pseudomonadota bacterium]